MAENSDIGQALDWDDEVTDEGGFVLLPAGTYAFEVAKIDKERFAGSEKMAPCPRAKVTLNLWTDNGWEQTVDRLMLSTKTAWRIARFFEALGFEKETNSDGKEVMRPHWNEAEGKQGYLKLKVREYDHNGEKRQANEVDAYLKPSEWPESARSAQTSMPVPEQPAAAQLPHQDWSM